MNSFNKIQKPAICGLAAVGVSALVAGCSGADGQPPLAGPGTAPPVVIEDAVRFTGANLYVARDGGMGGIVTDAYVSRVGTLSAKQTITSGADETTVINEVDGSLVRSGLVGGNPSLNTVCDGSFGTRTFDADVDRSVSLAGAQAPKGIINLEEDGLIVVADSSTTDVKVFTTSAGDGAAPIAAVTLNGSAWDVTYDRVTDRLFAALTNGSVDRIDGFLRNYVRATVPSAVPPVNFTVDTGMDAKNFHGITYVAFPNDLLIVSDVGAAASSTDGKVYYFNGASSLSGTVEPDRTISGATSNLGNPVDITVYQDTLYVAEKSNDLVMSFSIDTSDTANAPSASATIVKPESIFIRAPRATDFGTDGTDATGGSLLLATGVNQVNYLASDDLSAESAPLTLPAGSTIQNVTYDQAGHAYITFDDATNGDGVLVAHRGTDRGGDSVDTTSADRNIRPSTALVSPKGIEVINNRNLILVADSGANSIIGLSKCADGTVAAQFSVDVQDTAGITGGPWDMDFEAGDLFVSSTTGELIVYEGFLSNVTAAGFSGTLIADYVLTVDTNGTDAMGGTFGNMHGVSVVGSTAVVSDVGSPTSDPGIISVLDLSALGDEDVFTQPTVDSDGNVTAPGANVVVPEFSIAGAMTGLDNPVDLVFDGTDLYVAEKAGGMIFKYEDLLDKDPAEPVEAAPAMDGMPAVMADNNRGDIANIPADESTALPGAESVVLVIDGTPGLGF